MIKRNVNLGESRIDYLLECDGEKVYLELKSAVLREDGYASHPDCPSARGRKHVTELTDHVVKRGQGILLFVAALPEVEDFRPNTVRILRCTIYLEKLRSWE